MTDDPSSEDPIPRIPRKWGWKFAVSDLVRIAFFAALLTLVIVVREPCADTTSRFIHTFDEIDAGATGEPALEYRRLSDEELRERFKTLEPQDGGVSADAASEPAP